MPNDFFGEIRKLVKRIDPLIAQVEQWAKVEVDETTKNSRAVLQQKRAELNKLFEKHVPPRETTPEQDRTPQIAALRQEIIAMAAEENKLYQSRGLTSEEVINIVSDMRHVLDLIPLGETPLQVIRAEIERRPFLTCELTNGFFAMEDAVQELRVLKLRLGEFLLCRKPREDRQRIVDELQGTFEHNDRESLAEELHVDDSAIRAAIRGDKTHSGPSAEEKILKACKARGIDTRRW